MFILHCLKKATWESLVDKHVYGEDSLERYGFIHCSPIENFWRVAPNFRFIQEPLLLLCIDTSKVKSEIRWEDLEGCGRTYPHIYGLLNLDSVVEVLPFIKDQNQDFKLNEELERYISNVK